jgi:hypothetical protein
VISKPCMQPPACGAFSFHYPVGPEAIAVGQAQPAFLSKRRCGVPGAVAPIAIGSGTGNGWPLTQDG